MARIGMPNCGIVEYADHKARVLGGKQSQNPYKLGFELFLYIEDKWNKGRFGREYEECTDNRTKEKWDKQLGLGHEKVFDVRETHNDVMMLADFFDQEFCDKYQFYEWQKFPSQEPGIEFEYRIVSRDAKKIKKMLIQRYLNGGLPDVRLVDYNGRGKGIMVLEHQWDGRTLMPKFTTETIKNAAKLWQKPVALITKNKNSEEVIYYAQPDSEEIKALKSGQYKEL
jgi:stage V sporulation protein R